MRIKYLLLWLLIVIGLAIVLPGCSSIGATVSPDGSINARPGASAGQFKSTKPDGTETDTAFGFDKDLHAKGFKMTTPGGVVISADEWRSGRANDTTVSEALASVLAGANPIVETAAGAFLPARRSGDGVRKVRAAADKEVELERLRLQSAQAAADKAKFEASKVQAELELQRFQEEAEAAAHE